MGEGTIMHDCPCGAEVELLMYDGGSGFNDTFGQTEHWFSAKGKCECGIEHDINDSSL